MLFNSLQFIIFFFAFFFILFSIPVSMRKFWLLIASCYFYMVFKPIYLLILLAVILIDFCAGIQIEKSKNNKRSWLILSLISNIGILVFYKYFNFLNENISELLDYFHIRNTIPAFNIILPIGLSFHTFQAMSYTIEVFRGNQKAEKNILHYSLYVLYFPQLVAGPIERPQHLLPQLKNSIYFNYSNIAEGLFRIACGFFKKVVIADRLSLFVDPVFNDIQTSNGYSIFIAMIFFAFEIYCDFSGYTDIAIGISRMMGIKLVENFKNPFLSTSITEFWRRWHISLSTWFADYVYSPLAIKRRNWGDWGIVYTSMVTFLLIGLWHGANWTFVIYGGINGLMLSFEFLTRKKRKNIRKKIPIILNNIVGVSYTFLFYAFSLIFFRVKEVKVAVTTIYSLFLFSINDKLPKVYNVTEMAFVVILIIGLMLSETFIKRNNIKKSNTLILISCMLLFFSYLFGEFYSKQFIYFQF